MGMNLSRVTTPNGLIALALDNLPDGVVIETHAKDGGWALFMKPAVTDAALAPWVVMAKSTDKPLADPKAAPSDRRVLPSHIQRYIHASAKLAILTPDIPDAEPTPSAEDPAPAPEPDVSDETRRGELEVIVREWSNGLSRSVDLPISARVRLVDRLMGAKS